MTLGSGSYQLGVGESINLAISQSSVCRSLETTIDAINEHFFDNWVTFPMNNMQPIKQGFSNGYHFPGVIGAIDGTHVPIMAPPSDDPEHPEHIYVNRKHYHSINTQLVCDHNMKILHVNANFPGSTNDSFIWRQCNLRAALEDNRDDNVSSWLLGDSGYPLEPWLFIIPMRNAVSDGELRYNRCQMRARSIVERCNGLLKMRWRFLLRHRVLHYRPLKATRTITACCVLHNMCVENNVGAPHDEPEDEEPDFGMDVDALDADPLPLPAANINPILANARRLQRRLIQRAFDQPQQQ